MTKKIKLKNKAEVNVMDVDVSMDRAKYNPKGKLKSLKILERQYLSKGRRKRLIKIAMQKTNTFIMNLKDTKRGTVWIIWH